MVLAIDFLDMCMYPFRMIDNPIIIVPMAFLTVLGVVGIFSSMIKK